ncbi:head maturation protease, ClpP-related [Tenacibaculum soleae]|uniref:head maturation protease, ClpP-related n=1 Tax=Tenacibaculum soleae TaxID=447689 RepID=UPI0026E2F5AC|nr:head maturation protease, ClpP-related [Tenacibaculum soleae]MDO6813810.1 Clp protease ClpP [Tenacibaculum soleae]
MKNKQYKGFYNIVKNEAEKKATIFIYGVIGGFDWDSYEYINTDKKFVQDFNELEKTYPTINVRLNTPGGDIHQGTPIVNAIRSSKSHINIYVDGIAYSMGAEIAISGDTLHMYDNSRLMFHNSSTGAWGNAQQLREQADVLDSYDKSLAPLIANKLNITEEEAIEKYLNFKDNYFTAKEAKEEGFADILISNESESLPENIDNLSPDALMKHYAKMNFVLDTTTPTPKKTVPMNKSYKAIEAVLGTAFEVDENRTGLLLTEEEAGKVEGKLASLQTENNTVTQANATIVDNVNTSLQLKGDAKVTDVAGAFAALNTKLANTAIVDEVNTSLELEGDAKVTDVATAFTAMKNKIAELGGEAGDMHTNLGEGKQEGKKMPSYVDLECSIYKIK